MFCEWANVSIEIVWCALELKNSNRRPFIDGVVRIPVITAVAASFVYDPSVESIRSQRETKGLMIP